MVDNFSVFSTSISIFLDEKTIGGSLFEFEDLFRFSDFWVLLFLADDFCELPGDLAVVFYVLVDAYI